MVKECFIRDVALLCALSGRVNILLVLISSTSGASCRDAFKCFGERSAFFFNSASKTVPTCFEKKKKPFLWRRVTICSVLLNRLVTGSFLFNSLETQTRVRDEPCEPPLPPHLFMLSDGLINSAGWLISVWMYALSRGLLAGRQVCGHCTLELIGPHP